jgi:hypothetical protein
MTTPAQIAEWREEAHWLYLKDTSVDFDTKREFVYAAGYLCARTEIAKLAGAEAEIAALKQGLHRADEKLAALMPLAKLAALMMKNVFPDDPELFAEWCMEAGCFDSEWNYTPGIKATIEKLLTGEP